MGVGLGYCCCAGGAGTCYTICEWFSRMFGFRGADNRQQISVDGKPVYFVVDPTGFSTLFGTEIGGLLDLGIGIDSTVGSVSYLFYNDDGTLGVAPTSADGYNGCLFPGDNGLAPRYYNYADWTGSISDSGPFWSRKSLSCTVAMLPWRMVPGQPVPKSSDPCVYVNLIATITEGEAGNFTTQAKQVTFYVMDKFCREDADIPGYLDGPTYVYAKNVWTGISQGSFHSAGANINTQPILTRTLRPGVQINFGATHALWPNTAVRIGFGTIAS